MNETEKLRYMDFLSIALEQFDSGNYEVAGEFIDDVRVGLLNANQEELSQALQHAINEIDDNEYEEAKSSVRGVYEEVMVDE